MEQWRPTAHQRGMDQMQKTNFILTKYILAVYNKQLKVSSYKTQLECEWVLGFIQLGCVFLSELGILNQPGKDLN